MGQWGANCSSGDSGPGRFRRFVWGETMPTIGAAVDAQTKQEFGAIAGARTTSESALAGSVIKAFMQAQKARDTALANRVVAEGIATALAVELFGQDFQVAAPPPLPPPLHDGPKTEQVFLRLAPHYANELGRLAGERSWKPGTYAGNFLMVHIDRRPRLCDAEIGAVRQVARQLADMGRNINQVAKKLNSSPKESHHAFALELDRIGMLIDLEATMVRNLLRANLKGWGVDDGQP